MGESGNRNLHLCLEARAPFVPVVTQFVETTASLFGLGKTESLKLVLATEEIFLYLSNAVCPGSSLEVACMDGLYYTRVFFRFYAPRLNLKGLNIASASADDRQCDLEEMGLLIASRSVDRLQLTVEKTNRISLAVTKEKAYPRISEELPCPEAPDRVVLETPDPERVKRFALLAGRFCQGKDRPAFFDYPGTVADMVAGGEFRCLTAMNSRREIVGGVLFGERSERIVESFGPYLFHGEERKETGEALLDALLARIARTKILGLLSIDGLPPDLEARFEPLGALSYLAANRAPVKRPFFFRHLHEDPGGEVWSREELTSWLVRQYERLVLAREIRTGRDMGETRAGSSLFAAEISRERAEALLRPLWPGADLAANVERHISYLKGDGLINLFFEIDLGIPWHAELIPVLMAGGFRPEILFPFAGQSDLVIFQHHDATEPG
ncbi:MAG: hypothetical protein U1D97_03145 [Desulfuromonadales bacterium]|nr:hypothetical protein [Desulfuromonadales bacterium]